MAQKQDAEFSAQSQKDKAILVDGMVRVMNEQSVFIEKDSLSFLERDVVLPTIRRILALAPFES